MTEEQRKAEVLKKFMLEHFDFDGLRKMGVFKGVRRKDYQAQADRICKMFGYKTVFEYGTEEIRCHLTFAGDDPAGLGCERPLHVDDKGDLKTEPFISVFKSWIED